jgi:hypothetical protein
MLKFICVLFLLISYFSCAQTDNKTNASTPINTMTSTGKNPYYSRTDTQKLNLSDAEWKTILDPTVYYIAREKGTEYAFSGKFWNFEGVGTYYCAACGNPLFKSDAKFSSSCGWPSFFEPIRKSGVVYNSILPTVWFVLRFYAAAAMRIWAISLTTARHQPISVSASIPPSLNLNLRKNNSI